MDYIKLFVNNAFHKGDFVEEMRDLNVSAAPVTDGIIIDREAFNNAKEAGIMTAWGMVIDKDINNPLKTRAAEPNEWPTRKLYRYIICEITKTNNLVRFQHDDLQYSLMVAQDMKQFFNNPIFVVDTTTGEVMN